MEFARVLFPEVTLFSLELAVFGVDFDFFTNDGPFHPGRLLGSFGLGSRPFGAIVRVGVCCWIQALQQLCLNLQFCKNAEDIYLLLIRSLRSAVEIIDGKQTQILSIFQIII